MGVPELPGIYDSQKEVQRTVGEWEALGLPPRQHARSIYLLSGFGQSWLKHAAHQIFMLKRRAKHVPEYSV